MGIGLSLMEPGVMMPVLAKATMGHLFFTPFHSTAIDLTSVQTYLNTPKVRVSTVQQSKSCIMETLSDREACLLEQHLE